jgi:hypothetical protein
MAYQTDDIRRFLIHVLPKGFHRIRHYGRFANGSRAETRARELLAVTAHSAEIDAPVQDYSQEQNVPAHPCPCFGGRMIIIETFEREDATHATDYPHQASLSRSTPHDRDRRLAAMVR